MDLTPEQRGQIAGRIRAGESVAHIARTEGWVAQQLYTVLQRYRMCPKHLRARRAVAPERDAQPDRFRESCTLPAGHPLSWGLLTRGTCLEGSPYEMPEEAL